MAVTMEGAAATEAHRLAQSRIGAATARDVLRSWRLLDPFDLDGTAAGWLDATVPIVERYHARAAADAASYLRQFRVAELVGAGDLVAAAAPPTLAAAVLDIDAVRTSLLVTGPVAVKAAVGRGLSVDDIMNEARAASARSAMRHAMNGGRDTVLGARASDTKLLGYARAASGSACHFCAMLASRGPVYSRSTGGFRAHDGCHCVAEPVYTRDAAWPAGSRSYQALWDTAKATAPEGVPARVQFRRLIEGRA